MPHRGYEYCLHYLCKINLPSEDPQLVKIAERAIIFTMHDMAINLLIINLGCFHDLKFRLKMIRLVQLSPAPPSTVIQPSVLLSFIFSPKLCLI